MVNPLAASNSFDNARFLVVAVWRNKSKDRFPDDFFRRVPKQTFGPGVPSSDDPVEIFADDRIVGGLDNGSQEPAGFFTAGPVSDVAQVSGEHRLVIAA